MLTLTFIEDNIKAYNIHKPQVDVKYTTDITERCYQTKELAIARTFE